ncbi:MAG: hypothetical protein JWQ23_1385 [Herminiimonas sp.]|nr:hypothetical protein [Herminiimonas sp.]
MAITLSNQHCFKNCKWRFCMKIPMFVMILVGALLAGLSLIFFVL